MRIFKVTATLLMILATDLLLAAETARVLPKGIFRARIVTAQTSRITDTIDNDGNLVPLGNSLNRSVTVESLITTDPAVAQLVQTLNIIEPGLGNSLMAANLSNPVSMDVTTLMPALEYGVTDRLSLGIRLPILRRNVSVGFDSDSINNAAFASASVGGLSPLLTAGLNQFGATSFDSAMFARKIFTEKGYEAPHSFDKTEIGDLELGTKYNFYRTREVYLTTQVGLRAPTGTPSSLTNIYDKGSGDGTWATAGYLFEEYSPIRRLTFGSSQKLTYYFSDTRKRAVPLNSEDGLPSLLPEDGQVQEVTRYQGVKFEGELSTTVYFLDQDMSVWGAYQYMAKGRDEYSSASGAEQNLYYNGLSENSDQLSHAVEVGAGYSTVSAYRRKQFAVPGEVQLLYNTVVAGRNVPPIEYVRLDVMAYF